MLSRIEARMENLTSSLVSMRIVLERLEHKSFTTLNVQPVPVQVERSTVFEEKLSFPITTAEHILELNAELKNEEYSTFLVFVFLIKTKEILITYVYFRKRNSGRFWEILDKKKILPEYQ